MRLKQTNNGDLDRGVADGAMSEQSRDTPVWVTREPGPAYLFFGAFSGRPELLSRCQSVIVERFGPLHPDGVSPIYPFPQTRTYEKTMGKGLQRQFFVLDEPQPQDCLADIKHTTIAIENELRDTGTFAVERPINIDPGIVNDCRIILASTKDYSHRWYRGKGIWEELTLINQLGAFEPLRWTYPDFRKPTYHVFFAKLRRDLIDRNLQSKP